MKRRRMVVLTDGKATFPDDIAHLRDFDGFEVVELNPRLGRTQVRSKADIVVSMVFPHIGKYRRALKNADVVVVFNWYILPLMLLERLRLVERPRQVISMFLFIQSERVERIAFRIARLLKCGNEWFISPSGLLRRRVIEQIGIAPERVESWPYRRVDGVPAREGSEGNYIFTGGYTNRDYATLMIAVADLETPVVVQALPGNNFDMPIPSNVSIDTEFGPAHFEKVLSASKVVVLPLLPSGSAAGQSVLLQALQYGKPVVVTRHPGVVDYLGDDYPGYVRPEDPNDMRERIRRCLDDSSFRQELADASHRCRAVIDTWRPNYDEIMALIRRTATS